VRWKWRTEILRTRPQLPNPNAHHGWIQPSYRLGPQTIRLQLPRSVRVKSVELLQAGQNLPFHLESQMLQFTVRRIEDYEVAAVAVA